MTSSSVSSIRSSSEAATASSLVAAGQNMPDLRSDPSPRAAATGQTFGSRLLWSRRTDQRVAARLVRDGGVRRVVGRAACRARCGASVGETNDDVAGAVDLRVHEVQQVAARVRPAGEPDAALLHRVATRDVCRLPRGATVVRRHDVEVPDTGELAALVIPGCRRTEERAGGVPGIAGDGRRELDVLHTDERAQVTARSPLPGRGVVGRDLRSAAGARACAVLVALENGVVLVDGD